MKNDSKEAVGRAYCSTANLGAGFDVFGLALERYSDVVSIRLTQNRRIRILRSGKYGNSIPSDPRANSAGPPARALLTRARRRTGLVVTVTKNVPPGLGLGSSGTTAAACTKTLNRLLDLNLSQEELVREASLGERAVSGAAHPDNVAASLIGGFVAVYDSPYRILNLKPPSSLRTVIATPRIATRASKTRTARALVPEKLETRKAVLNVGRAAAVVAGFATGNIEMIGAGMQDEIAEPSRRKLIPGYDDVRSLAIESGASGVSISGAGPSMIAVVNVRKHDPATIGRAMEAGFAANKVRCSWFVTRSAPGARVIREG